MLAAAFVVAGTLLALRAVPASAGLLNSVGDAFAATTAPIQQNAATWASRIFYSIVGAEFLYLLYRGVFINDWGELLDGWVTRLVVFGLGAWLLENQIALSDAVMGFIAQIASSFSGAGSANTLTADGIMGVGWNLSDAVCQLKSGNPAANLVNLIPQMITADCLAFGFLIVAVEDLAAKVGIQFAVAVSGVAVGLYATRWSRPFAAVWPRVMFSALILTVTINAVAATGLLVGNGIMALIGQAASVGVNMSDEVKITATGLAYSLFALSIPALAVFMGDGSVTGRVDCNACDVNGDVQPQSRGVGSSRRRWRSDRTLIYRRDRSGRQDELRLKGYLMNATLLGEGRNQAYLNRGAQDRANARLLGRALMLSLAVNFGSLAVFAYLGSLPKQTPQIIVQHDNGAYTEFAPNATPNDAGNVLLLSHWFGAFRLGCNDPRAMCAGQVAALIPGTGDVKQQVTDYNQQVADARATVSPDVLSVHSVKGTPFEYEIDENEMVTTDATHFTRSLVAYVTIAFDDQRANLHDPLMNPFGLYVQSMRVAQIGGRK